MLCILTEKWSDCTGLCFFLLSPRLAVLLEAEIDEYLTAIWVNDVFGTILSY